MRRQLCTTYRSRWSIDGRLDGLYPEIRSPRCVRGRLARDLVGGTPDDVLVEFDRAGSLPTTHESQGSDMGLFGGLLGWEAADLVARIESLAGVAIDHATMLDSAAGDLVRIQSQAPLPPAAIAAIEAGDRAARMHALAPVLPVRSRRGSSVPFSSAAAIVKLADGTLAQSLTAASLAMQSMIDLICDPVANRVEVPCLGKNVMAAANALACANMALAGFDQVIPFDEVVATAMRVAEQMPRELRSTALGGLSITPTSLAIEQRLAARAAACGGGTCGCG